MNTAQPSVKFLKLIEAAMRAGELATPNMGLFKTTSTLTATMSVADLEEVVVGEFPGYARQAMAIGALRSNANSDQIDPYPSITWQPSGTPGAPVTIQGAFIIVTITAVDYWLCADLFDTPWIVTAATDAKDILWDVYFKNLKTYGGICGTC